MANKLTAGDPVTHRGNKWTVVEEFGGLVRITREGESKVVRRNQVKPV